MVIKVKVTKHGLTRCASCGNHIRVAAKVLETTCPFCNETLQVSRSVDTSESLLSIARARMVGRSGVLTASLFGLSTLGGGAVTTGCSDDSVDESADTSVLDASSSPGDVEDTSGLPQPVYGAPADIEEPMDTQVVEDAGVTPQPLYGLAPPDDTADIQQTEDTPDPPPEDVSGSPGDTEDTGPTPQPVYGAPADIGEPEDAAQDASGENDTASDAEAPADAVVEEDTGPTPQPLYGAPADVGEPQKKDTAEAKDSGAIPQPVYGMPPEDIIEPAKDTSSDNSDTSDAKASKDTAKPDAFVPLPPYGIPPDKED